MTKGLDALPYFKSLFHCWAKLAAGSVPKKCIDEERENAFQERYDEIERELRAFKVLTSLIDVKVDLRKENEDSIISIGDMCMTIRYEKAKLLKEVLG